MQSNYPQSMPQGGMLSQPPQTPQGGAEQQAVQMMTVLLQNPSPEVVQQIIQQLQSIGDQGAMKFAQILMQAANDPQALTKIATQILQSYQ